MEMVAVEAITVEAISRHIIIKINQDQTGGTKTTKPFLLVKMSCVLYKLCSQQMI